MEPLIYTDSNHTDQGVLYNATFDLEYGIDESDQANTFEVTINRESSIQLEKKSYVYIEDSEYGGIVTGVVSDTSDTAITYKGLTWHGLLNSHVLGPDSKQDYLILNGEAHEVLRSLIARMNLQNIFTVPTSSSGINVDYKVRYEYGYFAIFNMLSASSAKPKIRYNGWMVEISAEPISDYTDDELDTSKVSLQIDKNYLPVNHLICLGDGELKNRTVVNLYADIDGNISETQSLFGLDENELIYDYTNADEEELRNQGTKKFKELQNDSTIKVNIPEGRTMDIGDIVGATDPITGITVATNVTYKTVTIDSDRNVGISYKVGNSSASKSISGRSESSGSGSANYAAGNGIDITGYTISANVAEVNSVYPIQASNNDGQVTLSIDLVPATDANSWFSN